MSIRRDGFVPFISDWVMLSGERATIPAIRLQAFQQLTGQINDRQGRPVAGARVFVPAGGPATATDDQGRFSLAGINPGKTVVLAEQAGFRLQGWLTDPSAHAQVGPFTLLRTSETPDSVIKPLADPMPPGESRALANRLLEPYLHDATDKGRDDRIPAAISTLGEFDPDRALELLQNAKFADDDLSYQNLRLSLATRLAAANPVGAEALAEAIPLAQTKIRALASVAEAIPANERARKIAMLDKAAKLLKDDVPAEYGNRLRLIAAVAEQWLDMDELDRARRVLEEGKTSDNFFQTGFLGQLARLEPRQVIARLQKLPTGVDSYSRNLEMAEVAVQLATDHPAEAEQVFNLRDGGNEPGHAKNYVSRLCRRLARVDPTRARRIAASLSDPGIRACAWAYVALGLTEKDRAGAAEAIDRAIEELDRLRESGGKLELSGLIVGGILSVGPVHPAALLPIVEQVAPERLAEVFWRVVALHPRIDRIDTDRRDLIQRAYIGCECALLARYDREVAAALFEPMDSYLQALAGHTGPLTGFIPNVITAKGCIDPRGAVVLVETLTPAGDFNRSDPAFVARVRLAEVLGAPPERRWMRLCRSFGTQLDD